MKATIKKHTHKYDYADTHGWKGKPLPGAHCIRRGCSYVYVEGVVVG